MSGKLIQTYKKSRKIAGALMFIYLNVPLTESPSSNESEEETDIMIGSVILLQSRMIPTRHG